MIAETAAQEEEHDQLPSHAAVSEYRRAAEEEVRIRVFLAGAVDLKRGKREGSQKRG